MADHDTHDHTGIPGVPDIAAHTGDTSDAHDASAISVADSGANFTGTDVEAVLAELAGMVGSVSEITDIPTAETDTALVLAPDGAGGVEFRAESGGPGGGASPAAAVDRWHISSYASTTSHNTTITAASAGQRIIFAVGSYARDVNTPTCTNVTFTEVLGAANGTDTYLSVYVGVVSGGASGTTINVTAGSSNFIFATAIIVDDALTPTAVDTASATVAFAPMAVDCSVGDLIVLAWATNNASTGPQYPHPIEASTPLFLLPVGDADGLSGLLVAVGLATVDHVVAWFGRGASGTPVAGLVAIS